MASSVNIPKQNDMPVESSRQRLRIGSHLLSDAYSLDKTLLLRKGATIETSSQLRRLLRSDVRFGPEMSLEPLLDQEKEDELDMDDLEREMDNREFRDRLRHASAIKSEVVKDVTSVFNRIETTGKVDVDFAREATATLVTEMFDDPRALVSLTRLKDNDAYTFTHCVNVSILAIYLAMHAKLKEDIEEIGVGALLHDVGKMLIPASILKKDGKLTFDEMNIIRSHPSLGADLLIKSGGYSDTTIACVLSHHEKASGDGYPNARSEKEIEHCAMVTALADVYDALTTDRSYRKAMNPKDALVLMTEQMGSSFDHRLLKIFISAIGYFPVGSIVKLSNGRVAVIVRNHPCSPLRPTVEFIEDSAGNPISSDHAVDLINEKDVFVTQFVVERSAVDVARKAA